MMGNAEKGPLIASPNELVDIQIGNEKILGVKIDYKHNFDEHAKTLCSKDNNKLRALARVTPFVSVEKKEMNSFFNTDFNYYPLTWMLRSRRNNNITRQGLVQPKNDSGEHFWVQKYWHPDSTFLACLYCQKHLKKIIIKNGIILIQVHTQRTLYLKPKFIF